MVVLALGDVVGPAGCDYLRSRLPRLKTQYGVEVTIANGENSAKGNGITPQSAKQLFDSGVDVITTGNHALRRREVYELLDRADGVIRPANYHPEAPGMGYYLFDGRTFRLCVINLQGVVYLQNIENPFDCIDRLLETIDTPNIILDFHAEATAEKMCMGFHLDGRVSAVLGTHTHTPTADARVLPGGTGYITDLGMCGSLDSVLGVKADIALHRTRTGLPVRFAEESENIRMSGVVLDIDASNGKCRSIESLALI